MVDLPMGVSTWTPLGQRGGVGMPFDLTNGESIVSEAWGSIHVKYNGTLTLALKDSKYTELSFQLPAGTEFLLPATPKSDGCRMYYITVAETGVIFNCETCSDGTAHYLLNLL